MSTSDSMDIRVWFQEDEKRLAAEGGPKAAIVDGWIRFWRSYLNDFYAADAAISDALEAARATGELRWELLVRHWRVALWLRDDIARVLPEAIDLLGLAMDERVRDVPQRICVVHDVVLCYQSMDAAGYYEEIVENAREMLAQLPTRFGCANCARVSAAHAAARSGRTEEARSWLTQLIANMDTSSSDDSTAPSQLASVYEDLGEWEDMERECTKAMEISRRLNRSHHYFYDQMGLAEARVMQGNVDGAVIALNEARRMAKYTGMGAGLAALMEVEGKVAAARRQPKSAIDYLTQAARKYLALHRLRAAALAGLRAAEVAQAEALPEPDEALHIVARAAGQMPPASTKVALRLRAFGREPIAPEKIHRTPESVSGIGAARAQGEREMLEAVLASHTAHKNTHGVAVALYRLGKWHLDHEEPRAALDYYIATAILECAIHVVGADRIHAKHTLKRLEEQLPPGSVAAAFATMESGPPSMLKSVMGNITLPHWRWLVRCIVTELAGKPVVEPDPILYSERGGFEGWIYCIAEISALMLRFHDQCEPEMREQLAAMLDDMAHDVELEGDEVPNHHGRVALPRVLAALARDGDSEQTRATVLPPYKTLVTQICDMAKQPVWKHPGMAPMDLFVERVAQMAVLTLRVHDKHRQGKLTNLATALELMTRDLSQREQTGEVIRFVESVRLLLLNDGKTVPNLDPPLTAPYAELLAATLEAGNAQVAPQGDR